MTRYIVRLAIVTSFVLPVCLLSGACSSIQPPPTPTPTAVGTWETVISGYVFDAHADPRQPIVGATVRYDVLHSYFPELQAGRPNEARTDGSGKFMLPVIVHDTDSVRIVVEARDHMSYEDRLVGIDLTGGAKLEIGLARILTETTNSP